jgi:excinuclease Cho
VRFRLVAGVPAVVYARELDFSTEPGLYGLFATRRAALQKLRTLVDAHRLCPALCGLESVAATGRPCFACQLGRCSGACAGREPREQHTRRLQEALEELRIVTWPYAGAVGIMEECDGWRQMHVVERWSYLGSVEDPFHSLAARPGMPRFDVDTYAILVEPLVLGALQIVPLDRGA